MNASSDADAEADNEKLDLNSENVLEANAKDNESSNGAETSKVEDKDSDDEDGDEADEEKPAEETKRDKSQPTEAVVMEESIIYSAADANALEAVKLLLAHGAKPDTVGGQYHTALQAACFRGYEEIASALLDAGASVTDLPEGSDGPLLAACVSSSMSLEFVKRLIDAGADVNRSGTDTTEKPITPLYWASALRDTSRVKLLIERGAIVNTRGLGISDNALQVSHHSILHNLAGARFDPSSTPAQNLLLFSFSSSDCLTFI